MPKNLLPVSNQYAQLVLIPFRPNMYSSVANSATVNYANTSIQYSNGDRTDRSININITQSTALTKNARVSFWINGSTLALRLDTTTGNNNKFTCLIDRVNYPITLPPSTDISGGNTPQNEFFNLIVTNELGDGPHFVELSFTVLPTTDQLWRLWGYGVEKMCVEHLWDDLGTIGRNIVGLTSTFQNLADQTSTLNNNINMLKAINVMNVSNANTTVRIARSQALLRQGGFIMYQKTIAAGDSQTIDFGNVVNCVTEDIQAACTAGSGNGTGTITHASNSTTVTGSGTAFTTQLAVGSILYSNAGSFIGQVRSIASDTSLTLWGNAIITGSGVAFTFSNVVVTLVGRY